MTFLPSARRARAVAALGLAAACAGFVLAEGAPAGAGQGTGNPVLTAAPTALAADRATTITVRGTDYLVPPHAPGVNVFGGVYLFFGWVQPGNAWGPSFKSSTSNDGNFGFTYHHAGDGGDGSTRDDGSGLMRLVSFTPGGESGSATPFHMDDQGNWTTTLTVRGPTYVYQDPVTGQNRTVDCRVVQCGVYTVGAHGKSSRTNERFAPLTFTAGPTPPPVVTPTNPAANPVTPGATTGGRGTTGTTTPPAGAQPDAGPSTTTDPAAEASDAQELPDTGVGSDASTKRSGTRAADGDGTRALASGAPGGPGEGTDLVPWIAWTVILVGVGGGLWWARRWATR